MITLGVINLIFFVISSIAKSECDTIRFKPKMMWFKTEYWASNRDVTKRSWWFKYPLSFMWDGWHLMDSTRNTCLCIVIIMPFVLYYGIMWYWVIGTVVLLYILYGIIFEIFYIN